MLLTPTAEALKKMREEDYQLEEGSAEEALATCMGTESFGYALFDGGYLKPEQWIAGADLDELKQAIKKVGEFKDLVESLHEEM